MIVVPEVVDEVARGKLVDEAADVYYNVSGLDPTVQHVAIQVGRRKNGTFWSIVNRSSGVPRSCGTTAAGLPAEVCPSCPHAHPYPSWVRQLGVRGRSSGHALV